MDKWLSLVPGHIRFEQTISDSYTAENHQLEYKQCSQRNKNKTKKQQQFQKQINYKLNYSNYWDSWMLNEKLVLTPHVAGVGSVEDKT